MNLRAMASGLTQAVVPHVELVLQRSKGVTEASEDNAFTPKPAYAPPVKVMGDIQPLTFKDLQQTDGVNLQGTRQRIYLFGKIDAIERVRAKGGDLITDPRGNVWLVTLVPEHWPQWTACLATLQNEGRIR